MNNHYCSGGCFFMSFWCSAATCSSFLRLKQQKRWYKSQHRFIKSEISWGIQTYSTSWTSLIHPDAYFWLEFYYLETTENDLQHGAWSYMKLLWMGSLRNNEDGFRGATDTISFMFKSPSVNKTASILVEGISWLHNCTLFAYSLQI